MGKNLYKNIKIWLLNILLTDEEKYLIIQSLDDKIYILNRILINEKWVDKNNLKTDINDHNKLRKIFSSKININD